jgi:hypothetical protein
LEEPEVSRTIAVAGVIVKRRRQLLMVLKAKRWTVARDESELLRAGKT